MGFIEDAKRDGKDVNCIRQIVGDAGSAIWAKLLMDPVSTVGRSYEFLRFAGQGYVRAKKANLGGKRAAAAALAGETVTD